MSRDGRAPTNRPTSRSKRKGTLVASTTSQQGRSIKDSPTNLKQGWGQLSRRSKAAVVTFVAILAGWSTIKEEAVEPLVGLYTNRQPEKDESVLANVRPGMSFPSFREALQKESVAVLRDDIDVAQGNDAHVRDELFILSTVYVEAFVGSDQEVLAYTVTARGDKFPAVRLLNESVKLGTTRIADAPVLSEGVSSVAGYCGAQHGAYYEITGTNHARLFQTFAYGFTLAGEIPENTTSSPCPPKSMYDLPLVREFEADPVDGHHTIGVHIASGDYLAK